MKIKKSLLATIAAVIVVIAIAAAILLLRSSNNSEVSVSLAKCIGQESHIYVQFGCPHCQDQEALFGGSFKYLNSTDCYFNPSACIAANITGTPTWIISGKEYLGVQSIEELKNLTGC